MNPLAFLTIAVKIASDAPHILPDFVKLWHDIATGEGGPGKVEKALTDVAQTAGDLVGVTGDAASAIKAAQ